MADENAKTCDHEICNCTASDDSDYCSPYCQAASGTTELACNCKHPGCAAEL
ncbi:MAG TPA: hypothetical protein VJX74_21125 [Blastocatellia bacterium]|nr:hypothetical protein [Blastocatellia bacterium]